MLHAACCCCCYDYDYYDYDYDYYDYNDDYYYYDDYSYHTSERRSAVIVSLRRRGASTPQAPKHLESSRRSLAQTWGGRHRSVLE